MMMVPIASPEDPIFLYEAEALTILNESLMSLINAKRHRSTKDVIDGFVVWECNS
jgi:hypothetical protein